VAANRPLLPHVNAGTEAPIAARFEGDHGIELRDRTGRVTCFRYRLQHRIARSINQDAINSVNRATMRPSRRGRSRYKKEVTRTTRFDPRNSIRESPSNRAAIGASVPAVSRAEAWSIAAHRTATFMMRRRERRAPYPLTRESWHCLHRLSEPRVRYVRCMIGYVMSNSSDLTRQSARGERLVALKPLRGGRWKVVSCPQQTSLMRVVIRNLGGCRSHVREELM